MIIVKLSGGLGNQMFQYAAGIALATRNKCELKLDLSWFEMFEPIHSNGLSRVNIEKISQNVTPRSYELNLFNLLAVKADKSEITRLLEKNSFWIKVLRRIFGVNGRHFIHEDNLNCTLDFLKLKGPLIIDGYWQSEKYFSGIDSEIRNYFSFDNFLGQKNKDIAEKMGVLNAVSLHVRRSDMVKNSHINSIHGICTEDYYKKAVEYIAKKTVSPYFFIFSDDADWVKKNLVINYPFEIVDHNQGAASINDMHLMTLCKHNIIANSTFSWWGAWLNNNQDKIVIAPHKWFVDINVVKNYKRFIDDLIPSSWIRL